MSENFFRWFDIAHFLNAIALLGIAVVFIYLISQFVSKKRLYWFAVIALAGTWFAFVGMFENNLANFSFNGSEGLRISISGNHVFKKALEWQVRPELNAVFAQGCIKQADGIVGFSGMTFLPWAGPIGIGNDGVAFKGITRKPCAERKR